MSVKSNKFKEILPLSTGWVAFLGQWNFWHIPGEMKSETLNKPKDEMLLNKALFTYYTRI